ncbi:hypothetical protein Tco_0629554, partial [Tanacetum coccineum]
VPSESLIAGIFDRQNLCLPELLAHRNLWTQSCRHLISAAMRSYGIGGIPTRNMH